MGILYYRARYTQKYFYKCKNDKHIYIHVWQNVIITHRILIYANTGIIITYICKYVYLFYNYKALLTIGNVDLLL